MKYTIPFSEILYSPKGYVLQTSAEKYLLTAGVSEKYILMNLAAEVKRQRTMIVEIGQAKGKPTLLPVAITGEGGVTWITLTEDEQTDNLPAADSTMLAPFITREAQPYPDGFITPARTALTYQQVMQCETKLHESYEDRWDAINTYYQHKYPGQKYDARLHYYMIKAIRKSAHRTDDFLSADRLYYYHGWEDPFPAYLYDETFGGPDTWPSYARMRLMADNCSMHYIPTAIKVLKSKKANDRIRHYAIVLAALDEANDPLISEYAESNARALLRVYYMRRSSAFYPMLLENARRLIENIENPPEDILDDPHEVYMPEHGKYEDYMIAQRGAVTLEMLSLEQVRELWSYYKQLAVMIDNAPTDEITRLRWGNALRAFLVALVYNPTKAVAEILWDIYCNHNHLLYGIWSQDSHYPETDIIWCRYLFEYASVNQVQDNFWQWLQAYAKEYDSYCLYSNQRFFLAIYFRMAYHLLPPDQFYDVLARLIDSNYTLVTITWRGVTDNKPLPEDAPALDHRWENMFRNYNYYVWTGPARYYYSLVAHKIEPHPERWNEQKWEQDLKKKKKFGITVPDYL